MIDVTTDEDSAKKALAPLVFPLIKFSVADEEISLMKAGYSGLEANTPKGLQEVKKALAHVKGTRTSLDKHRASLKRDSIAYGRKVEAEANRLKGLLLEVEDPLREKRDAEVRERKRLQAEKERIEQERVDALLLQIEEIQNVPVDLVGKTAELMGESLDILKGKIIDPDEFGRLSPKAGHVLCSTIDKVAQMMADKKTADKEAAKLAEQRAAQEKAQKKLDADNAALEEERLKQAAKIRDDEESAARNRARLNAEAEKKRDEERETQERQQAEATAAMIADRKDLEVKQAAFEAKQKAARDATAKNKKEEADRLEREASAEREEKAKKAAALQKEQDAKELAERKAAARPDVEKLEEFKNVSLKNCISFIPAVGDECSQITSGLLLNLTGILDDLGDDLEKMK